MAQRMDANETGGLDPNRFLKLYRELRQARTPMETAVSAYRMARKRMKDAGVDEVALAMLERLAKLDEAQASLHLRNLSRYADWTGANIGLKQGELFGASDEDTPSQEEAGLFNEQLAEENGHKAGRARDSADTNPHEAGSAAHAAWARGWHRGQGEEVMQTFGRAPKPPKQPTRRARNPEAKTSAEPAGTAGAGEEEMDTSKVVPIGRGKRRGNTRSEPLTPKQRRAAMKAADSLTGAPVTTGTPVF